MKKTTSILSGLALVATLLIANPGLARMNGSQHNGDSNWNAGGGDQQMTSGNYTPDNHQMEDNWQMGNGTHTPDESQMGNDWQMGDGAQMGNNAPMNGEQHPDFAMTPEQQDVANAIAGNYADRFNENAHETRARVEEMILLMADDQTTLAQVNSLRAELYLLKQERRQLKSSMNQEISDQLGTPLNDNGPDNYPGYGPQGMTDNNHTYPTGLWSADDSPMGHGNNFSDNHVPNDY